MLRMIVCLALCLAPHAIYYFATELAEYEALGSCSSGAIAYFVTALAKGMLTALYTPSGSEQVALRVVVAAAISLADVAGLWYAIARFSHRSISNTHKFQAVGLGWAAANALVMQTYPIISGAWSAEFDVAHVIIALQANVFLVHMLSMAAAGVLFWSRKAKPAGTLAALRLVVLAHAVLPAVLSTLEGLRFLSAGEALALQATGTTLLSAASYALWQQCNPKPA